MGLLDKVKKGVTDTSQKVSGAVKNFKVEDITSNLKLYEKYFSESELWSKLEKFGKSLGATVLYPVLLLFNLLKSDEVNLKEKAMIMNDKNETTKADVLKKLVKIIIQLILL